MELIEDLGMMYATETSKNRAHYGIYKCGYCDENFKCQVRNVISGITTKCRNCAVVELIKINITKAANRFSIVCSDIHNNKYDYSLVNYVDKITKVSILCKTHGIFEQRPKDHRQGQGCPSCALHGFDKTKRAILYYLRIDYGNTTVYKIGITNRTVKARFSSVDLEKILVLKTWEFHLGADAYSKEQEVLTLHKEYKYTGEPILASGNSELFICDVLKLDKDLQLLSFQ